MMYDRHPTVLVFFLVLLVGGEYLYLPVVWPQISTLTKVTGTISIILPYLFLYLSAFSDPGYITSANHASEMARYPYDFTLFHPGYACSTCSFLKPARSKHCRVCKRCVARADHHCIFINNCVGAKNYHWFLLLLLTTAIVTLYGGLLGMSIMTFHIRRRFPEFSLLPWRANRGRGMTLSRWLLAWSWGFNATAGPYASSTDGILMSAVTLLALMTTPLVWGLLGYHLWLVYSGTTINESMKWSDWQADMDEGTVFKRRFDAAGRAKNLQIEPAWTRWPVEAEQVLVRSGDGLPPGEDETRWPGQGPWKRVRKLREVENLYDIGLWDNLLDVFVPGFMFRDPQVPAAESKTRGRKKRRAKRIYLA